jgi:CubicO group peptidase (beta-lactamase class C family)
LSITLAQTQSSNDQNSAIINYTVPCERFLRPENRSFADSIRVAHQIPELAYAVLSSDSTYEIEVLGFQRINSKQKATLADKFRIGSCTKTITAYITQVLVKQGKLSWNTKFFDLYPELKAQSNPAYHGLTLQDFITFRANLISWSYGNQTPEKKEIKGNAQQQRYEFVRWVMQQSPPAVSKTIYWSNPGYIAVGLMIEKATGKTYEILVEEMGRQLNIDFGFGQPNYTNHHQPRGHYENLTP